MTVVGVSGKQVMASLGEPLRWWRNVGRCPCYNNISGTFDPGHSLCGGTGIVAEEVVLTSNYSTGTYLCLISSASAGKEYEETGQLMEGDLVCSTYPDEIPLSPGDRVLLPTRDTVYSEVITRGNGPSDSLNQQFATSIERIMDVNGPITSGWSLVNGPTFTSQIAYDSNIAFGTSFNGLSAVLWNASTGPAVGANYTVRYRYNPRYIVQSEMIKMRGKDTAGGLSPYATIGTTRTQQVLLRLWNPNSNDTSV